MIDIKECFLAIDSNLKISNISNFDNEKMKNTINKCGNIENIVMYSMLNDNNKEYIESCYIVCNYLKSMDFSSSKNNILSRIKKTTQDIYLNSRRKSLIEATDKSNLNELNIDYYHDKIIESKNKNKKFSFEVIEDPVDLNKELTDDYIQECKKSEIKIDKLTEKFVHRLYKKEENNKYEDLSKDYIGFICYKGLFEMIYEDTTEDDIKEIYENINKKIEKINLNNSK